MECVNSSRASRRVRVQHSLGEKRTPENDIESNQQTQLKKTSANQVQELLEQFQALERVMGFQSLYSDLSFFDAILEPPQTHKQIHRF